jgi:hypothetical protein
LDISSLPPQILPGDAVRIRGDAAPGSTVRVAINDRVVASAIAGDNGRFRATVGFSRPGAYTVTLQLVDESNTVVITSDPVILSVLESTPTEAPTPTEVITPTAELTITVGITQAQAITPTAPITTSEMVSPTGPAALPGTGVALDRLGGYNVLLPLALICGLVFVTLWQRKQRPE